MTQIVTGPGLAAALALALLVAVPPAATAQSTSSTSAYVYIQIQGPEGAVYGFRSSSSAQLSVIPGSPWKVAGEIVGGTPTKFFTLGQDLLHSYGIGPEGAIESQLSQMPIMDYAGSGCGGGANGQDGAVLDHSGKYMYVVLQGGAGDCAAYQSYEINSDGSFEFDGDAEIPWLPEESNAGLPSILGNESFAYADHQAGALEPTLIGFRRESSGALERTPISVTLPSPLPGGPYQVIKPDASRAGDFVIAELYREDSPELSRICTFTADSNGNLTTTNTESTMQTVRWTNASSTFSPSGDFVVFYAPEVGNNEGGIQAYRTQGAGAVYPYTEAWGDDIEQAAWDNSNHLYYISDRYSRVQVMTLTPTSTNGIPGSQATIGSPYKMVVVSE